MGRGRFDISLKHAYDAPSSTDGVRILVERLWPRGVTKEKARIDHWLKDIAPSSALRRWYSHEPERWPEFTTRYRTELAANAAGVAELEALRAAVPITFVFAARDTERNSAVVLKDYLAGRAR